MSKRDLRSSVNLERDLIVADVREGRRVECGVGATPEAFSLDSQ